jgi:hypothetical protein
LEIKLTLETKGNPTKLKGLDSTVGVITDQDNNVLCLVSINRMEWLFECISMKSKTDQLFSRLTRQETALCRECKVKSGSRNASTDANVVAYRDSKQRQQAV